MLPTRTPHSIAAGDPHTAAAAAAVLGRGGNAVDAAVAATCAASVAEPVLTGPFGGGFALVAGPGGDAAAYDFFARIPGLGLPPGRAAEGLDFVGLEVSFGPTRQIFHAGRGAAAVPLMLPGLAALHAERGRLPWGEVVGPARALAEEGAPLSAQVAGIAKILTPILTLSPAGRAVFAPGGTLLRPGDRLRSPGLATLWQRLQAGEEVAALQAGLLPAFGPPVGRLTAGDLEAGQVRRQAPLRLELGRHTVLLNPPPSLGGLLVGFGLKLLADLPAATWHDEARALRALLGCLAATQAARATYLDGPTASAGSPALPAAGGALWSDAAHQAGAGRLAAVAAEGLDAGRAAGPRPLGSTTHVSCVDGDGLACSITTSNGEGGGHLVPGLGALANNFLGEEDINPGGFHRRPAGEAMISMMCPTVVLDGGRPCLALGTGGSNRIRTALLQVLAHHLLGGQPLARAVGMPRLHYEGGPLFVERAVLGQALAPATLAALAAHAGETVFFDAANMFFGGVHAAAWGGDGAGDGRRAGCALTVPYQLS